LLAGGDKAAALRRRARDGAHQTEWLQSSVEGSDYFLFCFIHHATSHFTSSHTHMHTQFSDFLKRYHSLGFKFNERIIVNRETCKQLLMRLKIDNYALGKSKVFLKYYHVEHLSQLYEQQHRKIVIVQSLVRRWLATRKFKLMRHDRNLKMMNIKKISQAFMKKESKIPVLYENVKAQEEKTKIADVPARMAEKLKMKVKSSKSQVEVKKMQQKENMSDDDILRIIR
jgi:myosin-3